MPVPTRTVRFSRSISLTSFIRLTSTTMPPRRGTAPSVSPVPPSRGTTGTRRSLAIWTTPATCSVLVGSTARSGSRSAHQCTRNGAGRGADQPNRPGREDQVGVSTVRSAVTTSSSRSTWRVTTHLRPSYPRPRCRGRAASSSWMSTTSMPWPSPAAASGRSDHGHALTRVSTSRAARLLQSAGRDPLGELRLLDREPAAAAGAVRPLGHPVDVVEREAGDRAEDLARLPPDPLALVEPTGVVVGDRPLDGHARGEPALADRPGRGARRRARPRCRTRHRILRVVLGERGDSRAGRAPAPASCPSSASCPGCAGRSAGPGRRTPSRRRDQPQHHLLPHQAEPVAGQLQHLGHRPRHRGAVERRLAVHEQHRLPADRQVSPALQSRTWSWLIGSRPAPARG